MVSLIDLSRRSLDVVRAGLELGSHRFFDTDLRVARAVARATAVSLLTPRTRSHVERSPDSDLHRLVASAPATDRAVVECLLVHLRWLELAARAVNEPDLRAELCDANGILWWPVGDLPSVHAQGGAL